MIMCELPLFDSLQDRERVTSRIGAAVQAFCMQRVGQQFHAADLHRFVMNAVGPEGSPESANRILRLLRHRRAVNYRLISRSASLYESLDVEPR